MSDFLTSHTIAKNRIFASRYPGPIATRYQEKICDALTKPDVPAERFEKIALWVIGRQCKKRELQRIEFNNLFESSMYWRLFAYQANSEAK